MNDIPRRRLPMIGTAVASALLLSACGVANAAAPAAPASPAPARVAAAAPATRFVDEVEPVFSDPTTITNDLFPISDVDQVLQLGAEAGESLRHEITLLPRIKTIEYNGQQVDTVVSQYVAYLDGRLIEVALDYFAQADDGAVWYMGEDVDNYEDGVIADHDGTWLAGRDGPAGMIMPAHPQTGDMFRPENIPGLVFEEVTVQASCETIPGPRGPIERAIQVQERLADGTLEQKYYAPGYGEFRALVETEDELVNVALAVPIDALPGAALPDELLTLQRGPAEIERTAQSEDWRALSRAAARLRFTWGSFRTGDVPPLLDSQMSAALNELRSVLRNRDADAVQQAAIDVGQATLDLHLRYRPRTEVDLDRLLLWVRQLLLDSAAGDTAAVNGDIATIQTIANRITPTLDAAGTERIAAELDAALAQATAQNLDAAAEATAALRQQLTGAASG